MSNPLCALLGIRYPIIQGAMANVTEAGLVSAVSKAGGLGILAAGIENVDLDHVRRQIRAIREATPNSFGVNIMLASSYAPEIVELVCEEKVPVVTTGAGNPAKYLAQLKQAGIVVAPVVSSKEVAVKMEGVGVDILIAEGMESGGYIGYVSTMALIPQVVDAVKIPVVAAGGIMDGRGMAAALMLGAQGVQMGTRFLATRECAIPDWCKAALVQAQTKDAIVLGDRIGVAAHLRVLKTGVTAEIQASEGDEKTTTADFERAVINARSAVYSNGLDGTLIGAGQGIGLVSDISSVEEVVTNIVAEYNRITKVVF